MESVQALNLAEARRTGSGCDGDGNCISAVVQTGSPSKASFTTVVTVNTFVLNHVQTLFGANNATLDNNKRAIFHLCYKGAAGTSFYSTVKFAYEASGGNPDAMPPQCMTCLSKGWGSHEGCSSTSTGGCATPGFYLPCGCSQTCVDVSGNLKANWAKQGIPQKTVFFGNDELNDGLGAGSYLDGANSVFPKMASGIPGDSEAVSEFGALSNCSAYLANQIVTDCATISEYHFMLWPALLATIAAMYFAYSMAYMQLDMDSLLYTVGSSSKKDN